MQSNYTQLEIIAGSRGSIAGFNLNNDELFPVPTAKQLGPRIVEEMVDWVNNYQIAGGTQVVATSPSFVANQSQNWVGFVHQIDDVLYVIVQKQFSFTSFGTVEWQILGAISGTPLQDNTNTCRITNAGSIVYCIAVNIETAHLSLTSAVQQSGDFTVTGNKDVVTVGPGVTATYQPQESRTIAETIHAALPDSHPFKPYGPTLWAGPLSGTINDTTDSQSRAYELIGDPFNIPTGNWNILFPAYIYQSQYVNTSLTQLYGLSLSGGAGQRIIFEKDILQVSEFTLSDPNDLTGLALKWASSFGLAYIQAVVDPREESLVVDGLNDSDKQRLLKSVIIDEVLLPGVSKAGTDSDQWYLPEASLFLINDLDASASVKPGTDFLLGYLVPGAVRFYPRYRFIQ